MIDKVINLSEKAIEIMTCSIKDYNISTVPGEMWPLLFAASSIPTSSWNTMEPLPLSSKNFNSLIFAWHHNVLLGTQPCSEYKSFLTKVEDHYKDMVVGGKWHGTVNQGTAFTAKLSLHPQTPAALPTPVATPHTTQKVSCHFCGGDFLQPDCAKWA
eukprot:3532378-Ditylum_brightwellii.AAC.1